MTCRYRWAKPPAPLLPPFFLVQTNSYLTAEFPEHLWASESSGRPFQLTVLEAQSTVPAAATLTVSRRLQLAVPCSR